MSTTPPPNDPTDETARMTAGDPLAGDGPPPPPPPPPEAPPVKRLTRSTSERMLAGVCGGVARYFGIDPVIVRILAVVLVFFGGAGALLYLAAVLLVPSETVPGAVGAQPDRNRWLAALGALALIVVIGPLVLVPALVVGGLIFPLAFLVVAALVVAWLVTGRWPEREAGPIAKATAVGIGVMIVLGVVALGAFWGAAIGGEEVVAGAVIVAGLALVAGAFVKPVRWLIPVALALAIPAGFVGAAGIDLDGGVGEKRYRPGTVADVRERYELGMGELVIDLRDAELTGEREVDLELGIGEARVIVADDVCVVTRAQLGAGNVNVFGQDTGGVDVDVADEPTAKAGNARLIVDAEVGVGAVNIAHRGRDEVVRLSGERFFEPRAENTGCEGS